MFHLFFKNGVYYTYKRNLCPVILDKSFLGSYETEHEMETTMQRHGIKRILKGK